MAKKYGIPHNLPKGPELVNHVFDKLAEKEVVVEKKLTIKNDWLKRKMF
jgi:hypothetical protein